MLLKSIRKYGFIHVVTIHGNFKCAHKCHAWNHLASSVYTKLRHFSVVRRIVATIHFGLMETKSFIRCRHSTTQIMTKFSVSESELRPCYQDSPLNTIHKSEMDLMIPASIIFDYDYDKIEKKLFFVDFLRQISFIRICWNISCSKIVFTPIISSIRASRPNSFVGKWMARQSRCSQWQR